MNPACIAVEQDKPWRSKASWLEVHKQLCAQRDAGEYPVVFIGDSITEGWGGEAGKPVFDRCFADLGVFNAGIGGDATQHTLWRVKHGVLDGINPRVVSLLIGTNNLGCDGHNGDQTAEGVVTLLRAIQDCCPEAVVILHALFPREEHAGTVLRREVAIINSLIQAAVDGDRVRWLDVGESFLQPGRSIPASLMPDFLHFSEAGYQIWADVLRPQIKAVLKEKNRAMSLQAN